MMFTLRKPITKNDYWRLVRLSILTGIIFVPAFIALLILGGVDHARTFIPSCLQPSYKCPGVEEEEERTGLIVLCTTGFDDRTFLEKFRSCFSGS